MLFSLALDDEDGLEVSHASLAEPVGLRRRASPGWTTTRPARRQ